MSKQDVEQHRQAFEFYTQGLSLEEIAGKLGVSPNTLKYWKSNHCKCTCGYHAWVDFKRKLQIQVPQVVSTAIVEALQPRYSAHQLIGLLESICSDALDNQKLKPQTWKELLETFKLILELRRAYGTEETSESSFDIFRVKGKLDVHKFVNDFMQVAENQGPEEASVVAALIEDSLGKGR
jgi:transcriptional regulator with XRE-family HTH domain